MSIDFFFVLIDFCMFIDFVFGRTHKRIASSIFDMRTSTPEIDFVT